LPYHFAESQSIQLRKFGRFAEGERSLSIERDGELGPEPLRNFRLGNAEAIKHRVRDIQGHPHAITIPRFADTALLLAHRFPPMRERPRDILPLARFFIEHYNHKFRYGIEGVSPAAEELLLAHDWPGKMRELRNHDPGRIHLHYGAQPVHRHLEKPAATRPRPRGRCLLGATRCGKRRRSSICRRPILA